MLHLWKRANREQELVQLLCSFTKLQIHPSGPPKSLTQKLHLLVLSTHCSTHSGICTCSIGTICANSSRLCTYRTLSRNFTLPTESSLSVNNDMRMTNDMIFPRKSSHLMKGRKMARTVRMNQDGCAIIRHLRFFLNLERQGNSMNVLMSPL